jgi:hypothetical protein
VKTREGKTETREKLRPTGHGFNDYLRINGSPVMARLNTGVAQLVNGITVRTGEYEVREGPNGTGWMHAVSAEVFREFYTPA